jgi:teichuronic acid biosynthesis glycosyltransferase TuaG
MAQTVGVIIPTYNRAGIVTHAIESALAQDYRPIEIIVADDGSTDDTIGAVSGYDVTVVASDHLGPPGIRNIAASATSAEYLAFLDADDAWTEGSLSRRMELFKYSSDIGLVFADAGVIDAQTGELTSQYFDGRPELSQIETEQLGDDGYLIISDPIPQLLARSFVMTSTVIVTREVWEEVGGFDESLQFAEDLDLWLRIAERRRLAFTKGVAAQYQRREDSNSRKRRFVTFESVKAWTKHRARYAGSYPQLHGLFAANLGGWAYEAGLIAAGEHNRTLAREYFSTAIHCLPTYRRAWVGYVKALLGVRSIPRG